MTDWRPTTKQRSLLNAASETGLRRSITAVCDESGVSRDSFYRWLRDDASFASAWEEIWHTAIKRELPGVVMAMIERAQSGDVSAGRLIADIAGVIKLKHEVSGANGQPLIHTVVIERPQQ